MKLRNQLLALACILLFIAFGFLYFHKWVEQKPFAIIIFVSDRLTTENITAARLYNGGADSRLTLENPSTFPNLAILTNYANDYAVPDSAAAASAIATGEKVNKGSLSVDSKGNALATILEIAREKGRYTGLITNGDLTDPGAAAFYAHDANVTKPDEAENLAMQLAGNTKINVVMGGGASAFMPESKGGLRKDGRDLILELGKDRKVVRTKADLENVSSFLTSNLVGIFSNDVLAYRDKIDASSQQPSLADMVGRAIEFLQYNTSGYVLVVDCELGERAAGQNDGEHAIRELIATDEAIRTAVDYAGKKALIIAVGKHSTGGMSLNGYPLRQDKGVGLLGTDSHGTPLITWATGPHGPVATGSPAALPGSPAPAPSAAQSAAAKDEPAAFYAQPAINNADDVVAVGVGQGSQALKGFLDNTIIFKIVNDNL